MALINKLEAIGNAIRSKTGGTSDLTLTEMVTEIENIPTGQVLPTSNGFANDSWETIIQIANMGLAPEYYNIGDHKTIDLTATTDTTQQGKNIPNYRADAYIVAFNKTHLNGGGLGNMTLMLIPGPNLTYDTFMVKVPYAYFSWAGAGNLTTWLDTTLKASLPQILQENIKLTDQKYYNNYIGEVVTGSHYINIPNGFNLGIDYISSFNNNFQNSERNSKHEFTFDYFANYFNRQSGFLVNTNPQSYKFLLSNTTNNWYFLTIDKSLNNISTASNSDYCCLLPIFTI